jgi:hypothetical protein
MATNYPWTCSDLWREEVMLLFSCGILHYQLTTKLLRSWSGCI